MAEIKNISAWRLNRTEEKELADRVSKGEDEKTVKRGIQTRKAAVCEERKKSAAATAGKAGPDASKKSSSSSTKKSDKAVSAMTSNATCDPTNAAYHAEVEADLFVGKSPCRWNECRRMNVGANSICP